MKLYYYRALCVSEVLLITAGPASCLTDAGVAALRASTLVNEPPKRLVMDDAAGKHTEEERYPNTIGEFAANVMKTVFGYATTHTSATTPTLEEALLPKESLKVKDVRRQIQSSPTELAVLPRSPLPPGSAYSRPRRVSYSDGIMILSFESLQAFRKANPVATLDIAEKHLPTTVAKALWSKIVEQQQALGIVELTSRQEELFLLAKSKVSEYFKLYAENLEKGITPDEFVLEVVDQFIRHPGVFKDIPSAVAFQAGYREYYAKNMATLEKSTLSTWTLFRVCAQQPSYKSQFDV